MPPNPKPQSVTMVGGVNIAPTATPKPKGRLTQLLDPQPEKPPAAEAPEKPNE